MMRCPHDQSELRGVAAACHYGLPLQLDQCPECGGIWFDESELFRARQGEAARLEALDEASLAQPTAEVRRDLACPRDGTRLQRFTDRHFPREIILERCPACRGLWLNRGHFRGYQRFREKKFTDSIENLDLKPSEELKRLAAEHRQGNSTKTMRKLGEFLSTPMGPGEAPSAEAERAVNTFMSILMTLLRVVVLRG
ncbi:zf-TFIIB domain-containing protein [Dehalogenimonas sp. 4OHTPN]|uniref:Zf-TFIIB domain-containing protein n=1 Tax=Dehalogenimonas sp. 4OHTPN TaxID=3166643 RepID=A0AAU8GAR4_9CHLR